MKTRELLRRATPELLDRYEHELPRVKNPKQFQNILRRKKAIAAFLKQNGGGKNGN